MNTWQGSEKRPPLKRRRAPANVLVAGAKLNTETSKPIAHSSKLIAAFFILARIVFIAIWAFLFSIDSNNLSQTKNLFRNTRGLAFASDASTACQVPYETISARPLLCLRAVRAAEERMIISQRPGYSLDSILDSYNLILPDSIRPAGCPKEINLARLAVQGKLDKEILECVKNGIYFPLDSFISISELLKYFGGSPAKVLGFFERGKRLHGYTDDDMIRDEKNIFLSDKVANDWARTFLSSCSLLITEHAFFAERGIVISQWRIRRVAQAPEKYFGSLEETRR